MRRVPVQAHHRSAVGYIVQMTTTPPEPVDDPTSYADQGYDDRQTDGMDAHDAQAIASRRSDTDDPAGPSDAERVTEDSRTDPPTPAAP